ncbi:Ff.00g063070.m01.CDS01 [Fusarium sp. VM40]|nr:Ff.00g063070.m01.CDS01 [Fusarium sp. VM40]
MAEPPRPTTPTGETRDQPAPDRTSPTFHPFPKLPVEIRLSIWKYACFPRSQVDHGIQYVTVNIVDEDIDEDDLVVFDDNLEGYDDELAVESDEDGYITLTAPKFPFDKPAELCRPNPSACLWEAGLLTACRESRLAVAEYHNLKGWREFREQPMNTTQTNEWYDQAYPSTLVPHKGDKKWCPMVVPHFDIFCIDTSCIRNLPKSLYSMKLLTPFLSTRAFTIRENWNIALKYDSSWNTKLRPQDYRLKRENTPRGLLANWLDRFKDEIYPKPSLWIIDDSVSWVAKGEQTYTPVYRDCDGEYVQIDWEDTRGDGAKGDVTRFFGCLSDILDYDNDFFSFKTKEIVKLLVRKDNEIPWNSDEELELSDGEYSWNEDRDSDQSTDDSCYEDY